MRYRETWLEIEQIIHTEGFTGQIVLHCVDGRFEQYVAPIRRRAKGEPVRLTEVDTREGCGVTSR